MKISVLTIITLLLTSCVTSPLGRPQLVFMSADKMNKMGISTFDDFKKEQPILDNQIVHQYVACVANAIVAEIGNQLTDPKAASAFQSTSWETVVFLDKDPNAFALPGGKIGVHTGLFQVADNPDRLATVIGHEVAHVLSQHANERLSQQTAVDIGLELVDIIADTRQSANGDLLKGVLGLGSQFGILLPYSRLHEKEADLLGLQLMARAGFDPKESIVLWQKMSQLNKEKPFEFFSTHPADETRIAGLNEVMPTAWQLYQQAQAQHKKPNCQVPANLNDLLSAPPQEESAELEDTTDLDPQLLEPIEGISFEQWAKINNALLYFEGKETMALKPVNLTPEQHDRISAAWTNRMKEDKTFSLTKVYTYQFFNASQGRFAYFGKEVAQAFHDGKDPTSTPAISLEKWVEIRHFVSALPKSKQKNLSKQLQDNYGFSFYEWNILDNWWSRKVFGAAERGDYTLLKQMQKYDSKTSKI
ncbi:peptidase M48 [Thioploca ingrica]|uniref:Peptidase M48 n=1 Tax=Thioploca ingrica TaxID=40754 RepID=A0A090BUV5_9GAMM|nr:peptidase M48 [Thioploca ingrica]